MKWVKSFAPATVSNVGVGFDILGFPLQDFGENVTVERRDRPEVTIETGPETPTDPARNTAGAGLLQLIRDRQLNYGFHVRLEKKIPIGSGLGGSATSAVASIVAANCFLKRRLRTDEMLHYALIGEEVASGSRHGDNVVPCLEGGLRLVRTLAGLASVRVPTPRAWRAVVLLPAISINTKDARKVLRPDVPMPLMTEQNIFLSGFLLGCASKNNALVRESLKDLIIEPQRARSIPGFYEIKLAALEAGALGCCISGSGPAVFALAGSAAAAAKIRKVMMQKARSQNLNVRSSWITPISQTGARVLKVAR